MRRCSRRLRRKRRHARKHMEDARAMHWSGVDKFEGTRLVISDDYGFMCLKAETVVGGSRKTMGLEPVPYRKVDAAQAEAMVLTAVEWVSEQHRA